MLVFIEVVYVIWTLFCSIYVYLLRRLYIFLGGLLLLFNWWLLGGAYAAAGLLWLSTVACWVWLLIFGLSCLCILLAFLFFWWFWFGSLLDSLCFWVLVTLVCFSYVLALYFRLWFIVVGLGILWVL